jgi:hypothetical protein
MCNLHRSVFYHRKLTFVSYEYDAYVVALLCLQIGRKASRVERNVQYNFGYPYELDKDRGKFIKNCVGIPPHDRYSCSQSVAVVTEKAMGGCLTL